MACGVVRWFIQSVSPTESATSGLRFAPIRTGLRLVISSRMILMVSGVIFMAELLNETIIPVAKVPEYLNCTPVTVVPSGMDAPEKPILEAHQDRHVSCGMG